MAMALPSRLRRHRLRTAREARPGSAARARRRAASYPSGFVMLLALTLVLNVIGLVMVLSASSVHDLRVYHSAWYSFIHQLAYLIAGTVALMVAIRVDYHRWRRFGPLLLGGCLFLLLLVLVPGIGVRVSGSSRWLGAGPIQFQPSELAKPALVLFAADVLCRRARRLDDGVYAMMPVVLALGATAVLVMAQPDMGTTLIIGTFVFSALYIGGGRLRSMASMLARGGRAALVLGMAEPYRRARMLAFLHPLADKSNTGYQSV